MLAAHVMEDGLEADLDDSRSWVIAISPATTPAVSPSRW